MDFKNFDKNQVNQIGFLNILKYVEIFFVYVALSQNSPIFLRV